MTVVERIMRRVQMIPEVGCWLWEGAEDENGYGRVGVRGKNRRVHRVLYEALRGPVPDDLVMDHRCRTRSCCNPDHMRAVTRKVNNTENAVFPTPRYSLRDECSKGHRYSDVGYYTRRVYSVRNRAVTEWRLCKECMRRRNKAARLKRRMRQ